MRGKTKNIEIILKKSDKITMKFLDGKALSGEVTNIKADSADAILLEPDKNRTPGARETTEMVSGACETTEKKQSLE